MRRIVIIVANKDMEAAEIANFEGLAKEFGRNCHLLKVDANKPHQILEHTLEVIRVYGPSHYGRIIVLFTGGEGFHLLASNLPCDYVDINLLLKKLVEVMGGNTTPQNKDLVCRMYAGAINSLILN
jgi:hypothetical protein